jgi:hypothetical protein
MRSTRNYFLGYQGIPLPLVVTSAKRGIGSFLTIDLVGENDREQPPNATQWRVWIYLCDWALKEGDVETLDSDCTNNERYDRGLAKLIGKELLRALATDENETCELLFSNDMRLFVDDASDVYGPEQDMIKIFRNEKFEIAFKSRVGLTKHVREGSNPATG